MVKTGSDGGDPLVPRDVAEVDPVGFVSNSDDIFAFEKLIPYNPPTVNVMTRCRAGM
jgi:hypothetical protein